MLISDKLICEGARHWLQHRGEPEAAGRVPQ